MGAPGHVRKGMCETQAQFRHQSGVRNPKAAPGTVPQRGSSLGSWLLSEREGAVAPGSSFLLLSPPALFSLLGAPTLPHATPSSPSLAPPP